MEVWKEFEQNEITHSIAHHLMAVDDLLVKQGYSRVTDVARYLNITKGSARGAVDPSLLEPGAESELAERFTTVRDQIQEATQERRYADALRLVAKELGAPIDRFLSLRLQAIV